MERICQYYLSERGCYKKDKCKFLHVNSNKTRETEKKIRSTKEVYGRKQATENYSSYNRKEENKESSFLSFNYFKKLQILTESEIIKELSGLANLSTKIKNTNFSDDMLMIFTEILSKIAKINSDPCKMILNSIINSSFFEKVEKFLRNESLLLKLIKESSQPEKLATLIEFLSNVVTVCDECTYKFISNISLLPIFELTKLIEKINKYPQLQETFLLLRTRIMDLNESIEKIQSKKIQMELDKELEKQKKKSEAYDNIPISYREENLYLSKEEIYNAVNPVIQKHRKTGDYESWDRYLNTMFYLVREDCYRSLRKSIYALFNQMDITKDLIKEYRDIYYYKSVKVKSLKIDFKGIIFSLSFECLHTKVSWSKRLLFGSLVVITKHNFEDIILATVIEGPDPKKRNIKTYECKVSLIDNNYENFAKFIQWSDNEDILHMFESKAYYESYRHILKRIQDLDTRNLPFNDIIINFREPKNNTPLIPAHFNSHTIIKYNNSSFFLYGSMWPDELTSKLDSSQLRALKHGLRSKVAIIQGPPGTGKTYVGSVLTKILLSTNNNPILVVCFTNHALDQFLSHISKFEKKILRIGGRCKDENLQQYMLSTLKKNQKCSDKQYWNLRKLIMRSAHKLSQFTESFSRNTFLDYNKCKYNFPMFVDSLINDFYVCLQNNKLKYTYHVEPENVYRAWINPKNIKKIADSIKFKNKKDYFDFIKNLEKLEVIDQRLLFQQPQYQDINQRNDENDYSYDDEENMIENLDRKEIENYDEEDYIDDEDVIDIKKVNDLLLEDYNDDYLNGINVKDLQAIINLETKLWSLPLRVRRAVMMYLKRQYVNTCIQKIQPDLEEFNSLLEQKKEMENQQDLKYLLQCKIVGMTTTGCAKYSTFLEQINFETVIIEEAAEVLESHISSILTKNTKHLILIGDHQQLKPNPYNYDICKNYFFDVSLFERLINNKVAYESLEYQRRMRPEFADFVRLIYKTSYTDHDSTKNKPNIRGFTSNIHFLNHPHLEDINQGLASKSNPFEAKFIAALTKYIIQQNYQPHKITILTMYIAQVLLIREQLKVLGLSEVKIVSVDNYQGEENDIVLLSLVRSNKKNDIGFLKSFNRICVAFSRAVLGFYVIGNFNCIVAGQNKKDTNNFLWTEIYKLAQSKKILQDHFLFKCQKHTKETIVRNPEDFKNIPEGGCKELCKERMECGHVCEFFCHNFKHEKIHCKKPCQRVLLCRHICTRKCNVDCGQCLTNITKTLPCGHSDQYPCHKDLNSIYCRKIVEVKSPCGHINFKECSQSLSSLICAQKVEVTLLCGHKHIKNCNEPIERIICKVPCNTILECEHICNGTCGGCLNKSLHIPCSNICKKILICSHECTKECSQPCLCNKKCNNVCDHGFCAEGCCEVCYPCNEPCTVGCKHGKCKQLCNELCTYECTKKCDIVMKCGHLCRGLCGEVCPGVCRTCNPDDEVFEVFLGDEDNPDALFYKIDCGHVFELTGLDKYMGRGSEEYSVNAKTCLKCRKPFLGGLRYKNLVKSNFNLIQKIKDNYLKQYGDYNEIFKKAQQIILKDKADLALESYKKFTIYKHFENTLSLEKKQQIAELLSAYNLCCLAKEIFYIEKFLVIDIKNKVFEGDLKIKFELQFEVIKGYFTYIKCYSKSFLDNLKRKVETLYLTSKIINIEIYHKYIPRIMASQFILKQSEIDVLQKIIPPLSQAEMIEIIGIAGGRWYHCPNGHLYSVGECGRPMQESRCPECRQLIGGQNHQPHRNNNVFNGFNN